MIHFEFKPAFDKSVKSLPKKQKDSIAKVCEKIIDVLAGKAQLSAGMGFTCLSNNYFEIRKGIKIRVLFRWKQDYVEFILAGSHDHIKKYLKGNI